MTENERRNAIFGKYVSAMKVKSLKWTFKNESKWGDRRISRYIKYFCLPIDSSEVMGLLDTTIFRSGKEGYLFTTSGIFVKEVANKLYYLDFERLDHAEVEEKVDEYYRSTYILWAYFKDGSKRRMFDYYLNRESFADYINAIVAPERLRNQMLVTDIGD